MSRKFLDRISALYRDIWRTPWSEDKDQMACRQEFLEMIDAYLGEDYDREKVNLLIEVQNRMNGALDEILHKYENNEISPDDFVRLTNERSAESFREYVDILGEADFVKLFGSSSTDVQGLASPEVFLGNQNR